MGDIVWELIRIKLSSMFRSGSTFIVMCDVLGMLIATSGLNNG